MTDRTGPLAALKSGRGLLLLVPVVASIVLDLAVHHQSPLHALLAGAVTGLGGVVGIVVTQRPIVAVAASAALAVWPLPHVVPLPFLIAAVAIGGSTLVPLGAKLTQVAAGAFVAGALVFVLAEKTLAAFMAAVVAGALVSLRPRAPTEGAIRFLRTGALFLPMGGMLLALIIAASSRRTDHLTAAEAVYLGAGLAGLLAFTSLAILGLGTLLESRSPEQRGAWFAAVVGLGVVAGFFSTLDPNAVIAAFAALAVPLATLAALAAVRLGLVWPRLRRVMPFAPAIATAVQWGIRI